MFSDNELVKLINKETGNPIYFENLEEMYETLSNVDEENKIPENGLKEGIYYEYVIDKQIY